MAATTSSTRKIKSVGRTSSERNIAEPEKQPSLEEKRGSQLLHAHSSESACLEGNLEKKDKEEQNRMRKAKNQRRYYEKYEHFL